MTTYRPLNDPHPQIVATLARIWRIETDPEPDFCRWWIGHNWVAVDDADWRLNHWERHYWCSKCGLQRIQHPRSK